jgi:transcriptional regulator with GAF, ATPase, and Fis domain
VKINCAALPEGIVESELFGHERGAFTGAISMRKGRFELAHHGTIFLDEIGELPMQTQAKLLRILQEREFERVGGTRTIKVNVRVIATTNRQLELSVERKEFRQDLFFRLNVVPIHVPPLREHREDVAFLANHFMQRFARKHGVRVKGLSDDCLRALDRHDWPGNVRELQNVIERAVILCDDSAMLEPEHCYLLTPASPAQATEPTPATADTATLATPDAHAVTLHELEKRHIFTTLERCHNNRTQAAKALDISVRTLRNKLHEYGAPAALPADVEPEETVPAVLADGTAG